MRNAKRRPCARVRHNLGFDAKNCTHNLGRDHRLWIASCRNLSIAQGDDVLGIPGGMVQIMHDHNDGAPFFPVEVFEEMKHLDLVRHVEKGGRLVE